METVQVLLVEDSPVVRTVVLKQLEGMGLHPDIAEDGQQALNAARLKRYDLILMDVMMPNMDGFEATRQIRQEEEIDHAHHATIVGVTSFSSRTDCLKFGMDDYLCKPVRVEQLRGAISQWIPDYELPTSEPRLALVDTAVATTQTGLAEKRITELQLRLNHNHHQVQAHR